MAKKVAGPKPPTKTELFNSIAEAADLNKKQVAAVFDALVAEVQKAVKGPGQFTVPGLLKIVVQRKEATPKRQVRNPATGEMVWAQPKPARNVVKVRALKALKDIDSVVGVLDFSPPQIDREIEDLIKERERARGARDWETADLLRQELKDMGVEVIDTKDGPVWRKVTRSNP